MPCRATDPAPQPVDLEREIARALAYGYIPNALNPEGKLQWRDDYEADQPYLAETPDRLYQARVIAAHLARLGATLPAPQPQPVGYVVYYARPSAIPSVLADVRQDGSGAIYTGQGAVDRLAELHRYGYPEYRIGAVHPTEEDCGSRRSSDE